MILPNAGKMPSLIDAAHKIHTESFTGDELAPRNLFIHKFATGTVFIEFTPDGEMKGYAIVLDSSGVYPTVWEIAVAADFRHSGVGGRLIDEIIEWAGHTREYGIELTVRADNIRAIRLYEAKGFHKERRLRKFYASGDGLLYRREL